MPNDEKDPFAYHKPTEDQAKRIEAVRNECRAMGTLLLTCIKPSRERSLALTKLEEVAMWANKAIVLEE